MNVLPPGWTIAPLADLVENLDRQRIPVSAGERASRPGSIPYYGATGRVGWIDQPIFDEDLILLGEDGVQFFEPLKRKAYSISGPAWVNNHAHVLRPLPGVDRDYLVHCLNVFDYEGYANGTTRLKLTQVAMNSIPIRLPPLNEQRRIVTALYSYMNPIERGIAGIDRASQRAFRFGSAATEAAITDLQDVPIKPLGELLRSPLRNGHSAPAALGDGVRTLTLSAVTNDDFSNRYTKNTSASRERVTDLWLQPGDIFIQRSNTPDLVGTSAMYDGDSDWAIFPDLLIRVRPDCEIVSPAYVLCVLRSKRVREYFRRSAKGLAGSMPKIDQTIIERTEIPIPDRSTQLSIVQAEMSRRDGLALVGRFIAESTARAASLRQAVLREAFAGRLVTQDAADEPADILLKEIRATRAPRAKRRRRTVAAPTELRSTCE